MISVRIKKWCEITISDFFFYSSASMASQVIRETTPDDIALIEDDDDMSECTLKDFAKKVPASSRKGKRI